MMTEPAKKRRGRPPKPEGEKMLTIQIRLPVEDMDTLRKLAEALTEQTGLPVSMTRAAGLAIREKMARMHGRGI